MCYEWFDKDKIMRGFRPLYGVSTILPEKTFKPIDKFAFSSPLRGFYNSTNTPCYEYIEADISFRPLYGVSTILQGGKYYGRVNFKLVFVPSTGFLQFYGVSHIIRQHRRAVFVPSTGFLQFYN